MQQEFWPKFYDNENYLNQLWLIIINNLILLLLVYYLLFIYLLFIINLIIIIIINFKKYISYGPCGYYQ